MAQEDKIYHLSSKRYSHFVTSKVKQKKANYHQENLTLIKEHTVLYIYLLSASAGIDD